MISDDVVLVAVERRRAEGEGLLAGQALERLQHGVGHVVREHPGTDHHTPERHLGRPVGPVAHLGETGSRRG